MKPQVTITATTTPTGCPGWLVTCPCATHPAGKDTAIVAASPDGQPLDPALVHGNVTAAHHPVVGKALAAKGNVFPVTDSPR